MWLGSFTGHTVRTLPLPPFRLCGNKLKTAQVCIVDEQPRAATGFHRYPGRRRRLGTYRTPDRRDRCGRRRPVCRLAARNPGHDGSPRPVRFAANSNDTQSSPFSPQRPCGSRPRQSIRSIVRKMRCRVPGSYAPGSITSCRRKLQGNSGMQILTKTSLPPGGGINQAKSWSE